MKKAPPFKGKDNKAEEMAEAKAVRSGKVSPAQYARAEKKEGDKKSMGALKATGKALATGKESAAQYGARAKMKNGGMVKK
jgi:hypothetical protein